VREALCELLRRAPCALTHLDISGISGLEGVELGRGLLIAPNGSFACFRLRVLQLGKLSLAGAIPEALSRCVWLRVLELHSNWLSGSVPEALGRLIHLETLALHGNALEGETPVGALVGLKKLETLTLGGELGGNAQLSMKRSEVSALETALGDAEIDLPPTIIEDAVDDENAEGDELEGPDEPPAPASPGGGSGTPDKRIKKPKSELKGGALFAAPSSAAEEAPMAISPAPAPRRPKPAAAAPPVDPWQAMVARKSNSNAVA
jgi:hypothetical protein